MIGLSCVLSLKATDINLAGTEGNGSSPADYHQNFYEKWNLVYPFIKSKQRS